MLKVTGLDSFHKAIKNYQEKIKKTPTEVAKQCALFLHSETVKLSPFDTGVLISGWQVSVGQQPRFATNSTATSQAGAQSASMSRAEQNALAFDGGVIWIANNVNYAPYNEYGTDRIVGKFMFATARRKLESRLTELARDAYNGL